MKYHQLMLLILLFSLEDHSTAKDINLLEQKSHEIVFDGPPKNRFQKEQGILNIEVNRSASALLFPLKNITPLTEVKFVWRTDGVINFPKNVDEQEKDGDDSLLRIGIMLSGDPPFIPMFVPSWIEQVSESLRFPTDRMMTLMVNTKTQRSKPWESPYSSSITNLALKSQKEASGWQICRHKFKQPIKAVGIWVMADGDNTGSVFKTQVKSVKLSIKNPDPRNQGKKQRP